MIFQDRIDTRIFTNARAVSSGIRKAQIERLRIIH